MYNPVLNINMKYGRREPDTNGQEGVIHGIGYIEVKYTIIIRCPLLQYNKGDIALVSSLEGKGSNLLVLKLALASGCEKASQCM